jgi:SPP1 gp7 family putative phage head morphogenesis protein
MAELKSKLRKLRPEALDSFDRPFCGRIIATDSKKKRLASSRSSPAIEAEYRKKLESLVDQMQRSVLRWVSAEYRRKPPELALDDSPARALSTAVNRLSQYWDRRFNEMCRRLARYFAVTVARRSDEALRRALAKGGMSVDFKMTAAMNDVVQATVQENVALIRSIPEKYFLGVQGAVMRSVQTGRDLKSLSDELRHNFGVTRRRAALISRDQNNKATSMLTRARQIDLGITQARWVHSSAGKEPRPSHVKASREGVIFDIREGWFDPAINKRIWPGTEINCRCFAKPVIPGFS